MLLNLKDKRKDYTKGQLSKEAVDPNPLRQFKTWMDQALDSEILEPNAMTLATCTSAGHPAARILLLKELDQRGFVFFTNYQSRKGTELAGNPHAAMVFLWKELQRQVRIEGKVEKIAAEASTEYFQSRPKGSQIGAWASPQSEVIPDREVLETAVEMLEKQYADAEVLPRPEHWGGYRLVPELLEFWQGRSSRLHDRVQYRKMKDGWTIESLAP